MHSFEVLSPAVSLAIKMGVTSLGDGFSACPGKAGAEDDGGEPDAL